MYQLSTESRSADRSRLFIDTCTSMRASVENLNMVRSATELMRIAVVDADAGIASLRDFVSRTEERCDDIDDILAAAGSAVVDEYDHLPHQNLHDVIRRVAEIEREVLNPARPQRDTFRAIYAG